ncbi:guanylate-binding protein 3-like protein [Tanacetum coccineum]
MMITSYVLILSHLLVWKCEVAATHRPCTKGLWLRSNPIKRTALDGTEYNLLILDSEGIDPYDQTGTYNTQIFSLAVLLSSMFIYNQMGGIDEAALDRLYLVTEVTKHIRDFYLDLAEANRKITRCDYLEIALRYVNGGGRDVAAKNEAKMGSRMPAGLISKPGGLVCTRYSLKDKNEAKLDKLSTELERTRKTEAKGTKGLKSELKRTFLDRLNIVCAINEVKTKSKSTSGYGVGKGIENRTRKPKLLKVGPPVPT